MRRRVVVCDVARGVGVRAIRQRPVAAVHHEARGAGGAQFDAAFAIVVKASGEGVRLARGNGDDMDFAMRDQVGEDFAGEGRTVRL